jgi:hypothetical protein
MRMNEPRVGTSVDLVGLEIQQDETTAALFEQFQETEAFRALSARKEGMKTEDFQQELSDAFKRFLDLQED